MKRARGNAFSDVHGASFELEGDAMTSRSKNAGARAPSAPDTEKLLAQYGCGPIQFTEPPTAVDAAGIRQHAGGQHPGGPDGRLARSSERKHHS